MNWKCWFFHKWSKWGESKTVSVIDIRDGSRGSRVAQFRTCDRCGQKTNRFL